MNGAQSKEQILTEFIRLQKKIAGSIRSQASFIARFRQCYLQEDAFPQLIDALPYPVAFFRRSGTVYMANQILRSEAGISPAALAQEKINLTDRVTTENYALLDALEDIFAGKIPSPLPLVCPMELFSPDFHSAKFGNYSGAFLFPLENNEPPISTGVIILMK